MLLTGAEIVVECLKEQGVDTVFGYPGGTILNVYESGRVPFYHFDWYRLESEDELYELGMDEYLGGDGIAMVEWPERCRDAVPSDCLKLKLTVTGENSREITAETVGNFRDPDPEGEIFG